MQLYRLARENDKGQITKTQADLPRPGPGEVRMRVEAASLNYRDLIVAETTAKSSQLGPIPLSDGAGHIDEIGAGVTRWRVGDRVATSFFRDWISGPFQASYLSSGLGGSIDGVLAESIILPERSVVAIPPNMSSEAAATLPCAGVTAWQAVVARGKVKAGETMLVQGTGGVALFALQIGVALGARVIVSSSSDQKLEVVSKLGASGLINYATRPDWDRAVLELTDGMGADFILELGGPGTYDRSVQAIAAGGRIAQMGVLTGFNPSPGLGRLQSMNADILGITVGSAEHLEATSAFLSQHAIEPVIDRIFEFEEAALAYDHLRGAGHVGKIVVRVASAAT